MNLTMKGASPAVRFGVTGGPEGTGLYNCITSNGDGSYSAVTFRNRAEADQYAAAYENSEYAEGEANVEQVRIYDSARQAISERLNYFA